MRFLHAKSFHCPEQLYKDKKYLIWNPTEELRRLSDTDCIKILKAYSPSPIIPNSENSVMIMLQNPRLFPRDGMIKYGNALMKNAFYLNLGMTFNYNTAQNTARYSEQIALDYYTLPCDSIYLKSHPRTCLTNDEANNYFGECAKSLGPLPIDFYPILPDIEQYKYKSVITFGSTSRGYSSLFSEKVISLSQQYWATYFIYNSIFTALSFAAQHLSEKAFVVSDTLYIQCEQLLKHLINLDKKISKIAYPPAIPAKSFLLVDAIPENLITTWMDILKKCPGDSVVCFTNILEDFAFYDESLSLNFTPIRIRKEQLKDDTLDPLRDETIFIFTKNENIRQAARDFTLEKVLPRVGMKLAVEKLSVSEVIDIKQRASAACTARMVLQIKTEQERLARIVDGLYCDKINSLITERQKTVDRTVDMSSVYPYIRSEANLVKYFSLLKVLSKEFLVIIAVKDTSGDFIDDKIAANIMDTG
jgi:hypothetical protein